MLQQPKSDIMGYVISSDITGLYIQSVVIGDTNTTLTFSGDIALHLAPGDAITIEETSVLLSGKGRYNWTETERYTVSKLTGEYAYADYPDANETRTLWNKVSYVYVGGQHLKNQLQLNIGWLEADRPLFSFLDDKGVWSQRNKLQTNEEIYSEDQRTMRLCWGTTDEGTQKYYGDAGMLKFVDPPRMDDAGVHFTGAEAGIQAPVVLTFSPAKKWGRFTALDEPLVLRILFRDTHGMLEPVLMGGEGMTLNPLGDTQQVTQGNATQAICGKLFAEMWTNDIGGFPFVKCYYGPKYRDMAAAPGQAMPGGYREYFIEFEKDSLRSACVESRQTLPNPISCVYQLVLHANIHLISEPFNKDAVGFYVKCSKPNELNRCGDRYNVVEYGAGRPVKPTYLTNSTKYQLGRVELGPPGRIRSGSHGDVFEIASNGVRNDGLRDLRLMSLEVRAFPANASRPIRRASLLKLIFMPLTVWQIYMPVGCTATCIPPANYQCNDDKDGQIVQCAVKATADTYYEAAVQMPKNVLALTYPALMDEYIPDSLGDHHLIHVAEVDIPERGFFPNRFIAQLSERDGQSPSVVTTEQMVFQAPAHGTTVGQLLAEGPSSVGLAPFIGEKDNFLIVRLVLGYTLRSVSFIPRPEEVNITEEDNETTTTTSTIPPSPVVQIELPKGYSCYVVGDGTADPGNRQLFFKNDENLDAYPDNLMGTLRTLGSWGNAGQVCSYTLVNDAAIFAGQIFYFKISVTNPWNALHRDDIRNVWRVKAQGLGNLGSQVLQGPVPFISLEEEKMIKGWVGNLAVLMPLRGEVLQPTSFVAGEANEVQIWVRAGHWMKEGSYVILDAPDMFDFGAFCSVSDLNREVYADYFSSPWGEGRVGPTARTRPLGDVLNCTGDQWARGMFDDFPTKDFNRAIIRVKNVLESDALYAFKVSVTNPASFSVNMHTEWKLWIQSPERYPMDGSKYSIPFNGARVDSLPPQIYEKSWGVYREKLLDVVVRFGGFATVLPTSITLLKTYVSFFPIGCKGSFVRAAIRITAPVGFKWVVNDGFEGQVAGKTCGELSCQIYTDPQVSGLYPNELVLPGVVIRPDVPYGFETYMYIPDRPPTQSSNAFYFEIGHDNSSLAGRFQAGILNPPILRIVYAVSVFSLCNRAAYLTNTLEFHLTTTTKLGNNEGFVFRGDQKTWLSYIKCFPRAAPGKMQLPADMQCSSFDDPTTNLPVIILSATEQSSFMPGRYGFQFVEVQNTLDPTLVNPTWLIGTYSDVHRYPALKTVDMSTTVAAPEILRWLPFGGILQMPEWLGALMGKDTRPEKQNKLIFYFMLKAQHYFPPNTPYIAIRAPYGYTFEPNCSLHFKVVGPELKETWFNASRMAPDASNSSDKRWPCERDPLEKWCPGKIEEIPQAMQPTVCLGLNNTARITLPEGTMLPDKMYAFEIGFTNPLLGNTTERWAFDFSEEGGEPLQSFAIQSFDPALTAVSASTKNVQVKGMPKKISPVTILFTPFTTVPARSVPSVLGQIEGSFILKVPDGFKLVQLPLPAGEEFPRTCHPDTVLEINDRSPGDTVGLFTSGGVKKKPDTDCMILSTTEIRYQLTSAKTLDRGVTYRLVLQLYNPDDPQPATDWLLFTYKQILSTGVTIPLDSIRVPGFSIGGVLPMFTVENLSGEKMGAYMVRKIKVTFKFVEDFMNGQIIDLFAPAGFDFRASSDSTTCSNFGWTSVILPMPDSPPPTCTCEGSPVRCRLRLIGDETSLKYVFERGGLIIDKRDPFSFLMGSFNPGSMPDTVDNFWTVQHWDGQGTLLSAATTAGWSITGQVFGLYLDISQGELRRSGAVSTMELRFTPTVWASVIELDIKEPLGFDFSRSLFENPWRRDDASQGGKLVVKGGQLQANVPTSLLLQAVTLGQAGKTRLNLMLYNDDAMQILAAYRLNFIKGYRQSGAIVVLSQRLYSEAVVAHHEDEDVNDVMLPLLPAWADDPIGERQLARLELLFTTSADLTRGGSLVIKFSVAELGGFIERNPYRPYADRDPGYDPEIVICNTSREIYSGSTPGLTSHYLQYSDHVSEAPCNPLETITILDEMILKDSTRLPGGVNLTVNVSTIFVFKVSGAAGGDATGLNGFWLGTGFANQKAAYTNTKQGGDASISWWKTTCEKWKYCPPPRWSASVNGAIRYVNDQDTEMPPTRGWYAMDSMAVGEIVLKYVENDGTSLRAGVVHRLRLWVRPSTFTTIVLLETSDGHETAQTTNDGLTELTVAVTRMTMTISSAYARMPPDSVVLVDITLKGLPTQADFTQLDIALPPGFAPFGMGVTSDPGGTRRVTSKIDISPNGVNKIRDGGQTFQLRVKTPPINSRDTRWFIITRKIVRIGEGALTKSYLNTTGWSVAPGFNVLPMPIALSYAPIENFVGYLAISFVVPKLVAGTIAEINAPRTYNLDCPAPNILKLPCSALDSIPEQANVTLIEGVESGLNIEYAFILTLITPNIIGSLLSQPVPNWNVRILTEELLAADATGPFREKMLVNYMLLRPTLSWRRPPQHDETSEAVITITFESRVNGLKTFLIEMPHLYKHDIVHRNQLKSLNRLFPTAIDIEWRDFGKSLQWFRILANDNVPEERDFIPAGTFQFEFPVRVPMTLPTNTEWYFSMCKDYNCSSKDDDSVVASFPIPNVDPIKAARTWAQAVPTARAGRPDLGTSWTIAFGINIVVCFITRR
jgi:hypothetical protein